jgi:hypothetical protein
VSDHAEITRSGSRALQADEIGSKKKDLTAKNAEIAKMRMSRG